MELSLSDEHELQVQSYLRFAKLKRDQHVREVASNIDDFKNEHIQAGEMYTAKEMAKLFNDLQAELKKQADQEIQHAYHTNALLVKFLLQQAQVHGLELHVDTNALENEFLLKQIKASEKEALSRPASDFVRRNAQLSKLGNVATIAVVDPQMAKERDALRAELAATKARLAAIQEQTTAAMRDKTASNSTLNSLKDELAAKDAALRGAADASSSQVNRLNSQMAALNAQSSQGSALSAAQAGELQRSLASVQAEVAKLKQDLAAMQKQVAGKEKELRDANEALNGKLQASSQFQQMKSIMQTKSQEVVSLRKRLCKYEPETVRNADA